MVAISPIIDYNIRLFWHLYSLLLLRGKIKHHQLILIDNDSTCSLKTPLLCNQVFFEQNLSYIQSASV